ncbi:MAG TPA: uracil-DNA glycosylase [Candidatus Peribacter riflensis]|uniref:Type-4 uracil-DNA glycosylase n=1 Tax=Candidatus Peribacter riflensis TaxID=1735162 RepID=A0A0S1SK76_9BACT|nr:MAG: DNA polymerase bacteriophage-type [Candidatus Peribacter riflensis]ALM10709.1 MAG: phage SPO1 DNA polymerase-related protein [Candidatus Peribacter riflensis]ALM11811.1 MAG: DNA polymerase bacteriophage-type [Candidatus Peribacter riflensis]ALM12914.1 MAG: DNA polymerase bacteriophage-type [Candidatus Peribacter riflensis]ALM14015.1 MAG: DNA polymerase bacteriophage-type [Candidatus Peribacter riflensis]
MAGMELTLPLLQEKLKAWKGCPLHETANPVLGEGNPQAEVMFIGEAPGEQEDKLGRPFVGPAGKFLDELLMSIGLKRADVYISNVVKYRPPANRDPTDDEKAQCMPWLKMEMALIKPKVIVPLGRHALGHFFQKLSITAAHGKPQKLTDDVTVFPIYHPAAALHNGNLREALFEDFRALGLFLETTKKNNELGIKNNELGIKNDEKEVILTS